MVFGMSLLYQTAEKQKRQSVENHLQQTHKVTLKNTHQSKGAVMV